MTLRRLLKLRKDWFPPVPPPDEQHQPEKGGNHSAKATSLICTTRVMVMVRVMVLWLRFYGYGFMVMVIKYTHIKL